MTYEVKVTTINEVEFVTIPKKDIKYLCFEDDNGNLYYYREYSENCEYYLKNSIHTRIPEFDKTREIEVEE